ncbi:MULTISPECIES: DUF3040 domain-containing protein [Streptomyces]|jgi:hypothetical protein|uniref:DUF3040 domain-containing protein n=1 Tax=Streptomyces TaxID=1883 RepID=UPI000F740738|nr:DUF3040 domain-containing protein [Streptomyces sp. WAC05292]RSS82057.1 DUF3040 domain-containing protein [Streptomyces sp. WAC05292]
MDGSGLSDRERRALSSIEAHLKRDRSLDRIMRFARPRHQAMAAGALAVATLGLLIAAAVTVSPPLIWAFAGAWTLTVVTALPLLAQVTRYRWQRRERAGSRTG